MKRSLLALLVVLGCAVSLNAGVLVNEALVNEPGTSVTLEWIEIFNDSSEALELNRCVLVVDGTNISLNGYGFLPANSYMIFCRRLIGTAGSPGFETVWGDSSGLWGDTPEEAGLRIAEETFSLPNNGGFIRLYLVSTLLSELTWSDIGGDGYSWERISASNDAGVNSVDPTGSTPGRTNSVSPVSLDLELDSVWTNSSIGGADISVAIFNRGDDTAKVQSILLYRRQATDSTDTQDTILTQAIEPLGPGRRDTLQFTLEESGIYAQIGLRLSPDDRTANNNAFIRVTGQAYPPLILSEFLPDPAIPLGSEWVELHNISDTTINLAGWKIGDELNLREIVPSSTPVFPGERLVIAQDSLEFRSFYDEFDGRIFEPSSWPSLNNGGDLIRLIDSFSLSADFYQYIEGFEGNYTFSRDQSEQPIGPWLRSAASGGTPGESNTVWTQPTGEHTTISVIPKIFSPDGDGFEDATTLHLTVVDASAYTLKIYDRTGNLVKTLLDSEPLTTGTIAWDGRSDAGNRLPIGIYICYFEAEGVESVKETVVIAR
ncbi:MAG: lamin tail domain-containing protein [bacterium]|nr:lamin tail domain-containing protein [bacterium]